MALPNLELQNSLTIERLRELFIYDPLSGVFTRRIRCQGLPIGTIAGRPNGGGYLRISIDGRDYRAHRLAWFYVHGCWPSLCLDHINGNGCDNRIANLRQATTVQNMANRRAKGGRLLKGITRHYGKWHAQIRHNGRVVHLGDFETAEQAAAVYAAKAKEIHGEFARAP